MVIKKPGEEYIKLYTLRRYVETVRVTCTTKVYKLVTSLLIKLYRYLLCPLPINKHHTGEVKYIAIHVACTSVSIYRVACYYDIYTHTMGSYYRKDRWD